MNTRTVSCCVPVCGDDDAGGAVVVGAGEACGAVCAGQTSAAEQTKSTGHDLDETRLDFMPV
ncbi:MAG TPA: hypothetical protein VF064_21335 [Pyrinomonadaceae bacterium]